VVLPTEAMYGLGCAAFSVLGGNRLRRARDGDRPPPVLLPSPSAVSEFTDLDDVAQDLTEAFWPGGLTLVCRVRAELSWAAWAARGTVSVRMPLHPVALELLDGTGPLAVTGAAQIGRTPATDCDVAQEMFGDNVATYLDVGPLPEAEPSTIVDVTGDRVRVLRVGAVSPADLGEAVGADRIESATAEATGR
jgi:tRNA threonylcarbamoyl adenosine modification protein (Sua5/YciO/YrdC/YwlC family)